ncbi:DUF2894 domain-containing protein [Trinickia caryophylli]|uniref:DUF2894 domain-containing protein n=1 Tax=Trinickia caryophylli TaxID=28094 RepID=UPI0020CB1316|nr:DUF2894 domain-containing protein [Trinickia caryophylli]
MWRASGADRMDRLRFDLIDAMERRTAGYGGEPRKVLDDKLARLVEAYAADLERTCAEARCNAGQDAAAACADTGADIGRGRQARGPLGELADKLSSRWPASGQDDTERGGRAQAGVEPPTDVVDYFRGVWSKVSTERQLRQSLEQVPGNAGPLNSNSLVYRALMLMRELSPDYLQRFMAYADTLSWMEQMSGGLVMPGRDAARAVGGRKPPKAKSR